MTRIRELLIPFEYTRVDRIIELAFTAVTEVGEGLEKEAAAFEDEVADADEVSTVVKLIQQRTPRDIIEQLRSKIITALSAREGAPLIKKSQALYWSPEDNLEFRVACTISKRYERTEDYWYAYHPDWDRFLTDAQKGYLVLGCVDLSTAFVIPRDWIYNKLDELYVSKGSNSPYWHIVLIKDGDHMVLKTRTGGLYPISQFATNVAGVNT